MSRGERKNLNPSRIAKPIETLGEVFGRAMVELVRDVRTQELRLLLWDGERETIAPLVKYQGRTYKPPALSNNLLRELTLPTHRSAHGSTGEILSEACKLTYEFTQLPEKFVAIVGRVVLSSARLEAAQTAPALAVSGPDMMRATNFFSLLHCISRHPVRMSAVTPAALCALPSGLGCTLLIRQSIISPKLQSLLDDASQRDQQILWRGDLLSLHGCQVIYSEIGLDNGPRSPRYLHIPMLPSDDRLPLLDAEKQSRIASNFQAKLLDFRLSKLGEASVARFDAPLFTPELRPLVQSLLAATPDDLALQNKTKDLLMDEDTDARSAKWLDLSTVIVESILVLCSEGKRVTYVGEIADLAQTFWKRRGKEVSVDPGAVGKRLPLLGFRTERRDAKGVKLLLTKVVYARARQLARDLDVPADESMRSEDRAPGKEGTSSRAVDGR